MITRSGVNSSAIAIIARCRMPPDSWMRVAAQVRRVDADHPQHLGRPVAISSRDVFPCARIASLNCAPIDLTGFSAFIALCMTTDMSRQRTADSCRVGQPHQVAALEGDAAAGDPAGGASSWAMANSRVDFPQPDSPTMPRNSPRPRLKDTSSTARTSARSRA